MFRRRSIAKLLSVLIAMCCGADWVHAQMGGGMGGGGMGGPSAGGADRPKFYERVLEEGGPRLKNDETDVLVVEVNFEGLQVVPENRVYTRVQTRVDRNYSPETVMEDVRRLYGMEYFERVSHRVEPRPDGVAVTFTVKERPLVKEVVFHGNRGANERELKGRAGLQAGDPMSDTAIESARRRLVDFYREEGYQDATVQALKGVADHPRTVMFVINEGELVRIKEVHIHGSQFIDDARLKKIVTARGGWSPLNVVGLKRYWGNKATDTLLDDDVQKLQLYYRNLGFFDATIGRLPQYDADGKWMTVDYFVEEGIRYEVTDVQIVGNRYIPTEPLKAKLILLPGYPFDRSQMDADVRSMLDIYGNEGFFFADIQAQPTLLDEHGKLAMVYKIQEGDRCKCGPIRIHIDGDTIHTRLNPVLNRMDGIRPGQLLDRGKVEQAERRLKASGLFTTNPAEGDPPRIEVATPKLSEIEETWN